MCLNYILDIQYGYKDDDLGVVIWVTVSQSGRCMSCGYVPQAYVGIMGLNYAGENSGWHSRAKNEA